MVKPSVTLQDVKAAAQKLAQVVYCTPLERNHTFSKMAGTELFLKLENLQRTGSFKVRGAANCIQNLPAEKKACGVITASAGNHAQGVARAASELGIKATIVMPEAAPLAKIEATKGYGAEVVLAGADYDAAQAAALALQAKTGATFVHAYDQPDVIAGQGTIGLELLAQQPDLDTVVVPVGGGGLLAGMAVAIKETNPRIKVYGVQAAGASAMYLSTHAHKWVATPEVNTIADGIAVKKPGKVTFDLIEKYVDDIVVVTDDDIAATVLLLMERAKLIAEGAGATALAGIMHGSLTLGQKTAAVLSGGNIDVNMISRIIENGLVKSGRRMKIVTSLLDRPGELLKFISYIKEYRANIIYISHERTGKDLAIGQTLVEMDLEISNHEHGEGLILALRRAGYHVDFI
ncbi:MAG TPA: threonine ammonia-lyase [Candidatus Avacidaminococcus intestinavium]|uniref:threonine ammonia-lyase n=1 Tax=Candidatus Avacidaminococcus intestinavium TaxID=2840684 RepID=A0A9D1SLH3_9FIRM|nr:threonine ammonia-lyase [Candidatus Avacidaminococcus intestinavium]